jgi:hypothetical protein
MPAIHGTVSRYNSGCRCQACRDAINALHRAYRAEQKAQAAACEGSALEDLELPDVGSSDPVYPDLDTDNEVNKLAQAIAELPSYRPIPLAARLANLPTQRRAPFNWSRRLPTIAKSREAQQAAVARDQKAQAVAASDQEMYLLKRYLAGLGESPSLIAARRRYGR